MNKYLKVLNQDTLFQQKDVDKVYHLLTQVIDTRIVCDLPGV